MKKYIYVRDYVTVYVLLKKCLSQIHHNKNMKAVEKDEFCSLANLFVKKYVGKSYERLVITQSVTKN